MSNIIYIYYSKVPFVNVVYFPCFPQIPKRVESSFGIHKSPWQHSGSLRIQAHSSLEQETSTKIYKN